MGNKMLILSHNVDLGEQFYPRFLSKFTVFIFAGYTFQHECDGTHSNTQMQAKHLATQAKT